MLTADVSHGQSGWVEDGPFYAYLSGAAFGTTVSEGRGGWATDVLLGELEISERSHNARVAIDFTLPDGMPPGEYTVGVCNDPCTTGLGDLIGGSLYVGVDPPPFAEEITTTQGDPVEASIAGAAIVAQTIDTPPKANSSAYRSLAPHRSRPSGLSAAWVATSAGLAAMVLGLAVASRQRSGGA